MRAAVYTRVSSEEQLDGYSLAAQAEAAQRFAKFRGWDVVRIYEERGRSGKNALRPEFQQMIRDAQAGQFDVIIVHKLDRFSRSILDMFTYLKELKEIDVSLVSVSEDFDFTTPIGKVILAVLAAFAEWYLDNLRTEIIKGKKERARQGHWNGTLGWGYTTPRKLRAKLVQLGEDFKAGNVEEREYERLASLYENTLERYGDLIETAAVPCPVNASGVRLAFELYADGLRSMQEVADALMDRGYRMESRLGNSIILKDTLEDILQNRFYLGETSYGVRVPGKKREWLRGVHEALITRDLFDRVQEARKRRGEVMQRTHRAAKRVYPLSSLLVCAECGSFYQGNTDGKYFYYRDPATPKRRVCHQKVRSLPAIDLEEQLQAVIDAIELPEGWQSDVRELLAKEAKSGDAEAQAQHRASIETRLERMKKLYILGDLEEGEYVNAKNELMAQLDQLPLANGLTLEELEAAGEWLTLLGSLIRNALPEERRALYRAVFRRIYIRDGKIESIEPTRLVWALLDSLNGRITGRTGL